jgi:hypothetical protein
MVNTQLFEERITKEGIKALRQIIGLSPPQIFSPGIDVDGEFISSPNYSIPLKSKRKNFGWLNIKIEWLETPKECINYYRISLNLSDKPKDIKVISDEHFKEVLDFPLSSISTYSPSLILKITIHEETWQATECEESIAYDRAIIFHREDESRFSISASDTIADLLEFTKSEQRIKEIIENCRCRLTIE